MVVVEESSSILLRWFLEHFSNLRPLIADGCVLIAILIIRVERARYRVAL